MNIVLKIFSKWPLFFAFLCVLILPSCKSFDNLSIGHVNTNIDKDEVVNLIIKGNLSYDEIFIKRALIELDFHDQNQAVRANIYIKRDSAIIISVVPFMAIEMYRIMFDKKGFYLVDRMNKTIIESDYASLSENFFVSLDYSQIQSILTNSVFTYPVNNLRNLMKYKGLFTDEHYTFTSAHVSKFKNNSSIQTIDVLPGLFRVYNTFISYPDHNMSMKISYDDYSYITDSIIFPSRMTFNGIRNEQTIFMSFTYLSVVIDGDQSLSFSVPSNYAKISL